MIPVVDLSQVHVAWIEIRAQGFVLYGFMLYSDQDTMLVEFMRRQSGLAELDDLSGPECAIFVIESPSRKWVEQAKRRNHPWWRLIGSRDDRFNLNDLDDGAELPKYLGSIVEKLLDHQDSISITVGNDDPVTLRHLREPDYSALYDRREIWAVVQHFGLSPQEIPCLVFFRDLEDGAVDVVCLRELRTLRQTTLSFRAFFGSPHFARLLGGGPPLCLKSSAER
jgi:hypothetical protein